MAAPLDPPALAREILAALSPARTLPHAVAMNSAGIRIGADTLPWASLPAVSVAGLGKAALAQCSHLARQLAAARPASVDARRGIAVAPRGAPATALGTPELEIVPGSHPLPDAASLAAAHRLLDWFGARRDGELVLFCVSGGGSALAEAPREPFTFDEQRALFATLLQRGAPIDAANLLRSELSAIKNGGLAAAAPTARVVSLVTSDVPHDQLALVASGPGLHRPLDPVEVRRTAERWLEPSAAARILDQLDAPARTARQQHLATATAAARAVRVADWRTAIAAARDALADWTVLTPTAPADAPLTVGLPAFLDRFAAELQRRDARPLAVLSAGEWTVPMDGSVGAGRGGRASEFVCRAARALTTDRRFAATSGRLVAIGLATDGRDGNSAAAGGWLDAATIARADRDGHDLDAHLRDHDTAGFLARCGTAFHPGPTDTNLMDLHALIHVPT